MAGNGEEYELETIVKNRRNQQPSTESCNDNSSSSRPQSKTYNNSSTIFIRHLSDDDEDYKGGDSRRRGSASNSNGNTSSSLSSNNEELNATPARPRKDHLQVVPGSLLSSRKPGRDNMYESPAMEAASSNPLPLTPLSLPNKISSSSSNGGSALDKEIGVKANINWDREEIRTMHDIFPALDITIVVKLLDVNGYDLEKAIDAGLAFVATLEIEDQSNKRASKSVAISDSQNSSGHRNSISNKAENRSIGWGSISVNPFASFSSSLTPVSDSVNSAFASNSDGSSKLLEEKLYAVVAKGEGDSKNRHNRGLSLKIEQSFLTTPRYRLQTNNKSDVYTEFTIWFRRDNDKLGITINDVDGEVIIHTLHCKANGQPLLAQEAGVRIGDVLTGVNFDYFSPGVEVQDVIEILNASGSYVALHFSRRNAFDNSTNTYIANHIESNGTSIKGNDDTHIFAPILIQQQVISRDKSVVLSKALGRLKERVLQWDHYDTIIKNNLDPNHNNGAKSSSSIFNSYNQTADISDASSSAFDGIFGKANPTFSVSSDSGSTSVYDGSRAKASAPINSSLRGPARTNNGSLRDSTSYWSIRPALAVRLIKAEEKGDHKVYVIWIQDVKSGAEWFVRRRFREFFDFRDYLVTVRPSIARIEFPPKRMSMTETSLLVSERLFMLQRFLRRISSLVCCNCIHPSTAKVLSALHYFLEVDEHSIMIRELEASSTLFSIKNTPQVYLHSILQLQVMDKVLCAYIDNFFDDSVNDTDKSSIEYARGVFYNVRDFIDNLQTVLFDGLSEDCAEIINKCITTEKVILRNSIRRSIHIPSDISMAQLENEMANNGLSKLESLQSDLGRYNEDEIQNVARAAIRRQVEVEVYIPCSKRLKNLIKRSLAARERDIQEKITVVIDKPQSFFGIPKKHVSENNWNKPVNILREIRHKMLVCDKIEILLDCAKAIPTCFKIEHPDAEKPLGADEFLPIFIYVLVRANLPNLLLLIEELQILCDPDKKLSEAGYYIATFEASVQHLEDADIKNGDGDTIFSSLYSRRNGNDFASSWDDDDDGTDSIAESNRSVIAGDSIDFNEISGSCDLSIDEANDEIQ